MKERIILIGIILIALLLRFYKLGEIPPALHRDEASTGYNAYSILSTGKDEYGESFPLVFKAFGDFKRPINIYLTSLTIPIFGLTELSVRVPIAFIGSLTVVAIYFLAKVLFKKSSIPLLVAFIFAISPWHIYMSRTGLGWNVIGLFLTLLGIYSLLIARSRSILLILSSIFFGLSLFSYATNQLFTPLFLILLAMVKFRKLRWKASYFLPIIIFLTFFLVFIKVYTPVFLTNKVGSSFYNQHFIYENIEIPRIRSQNSLFSRLFYNRPLVVSWQIAKNYFKVLSPQFLFLNKEDNPAYSLKNIGNLYLFEFPFLLLGFVLIIIKEKKFSSLIILWFLLSLLPSALTKNPYSSTRSLMLLPLLSFAIAYGIFFVFEFLKRKSAWVLKGFFLSIILLYFFHLLAFVEEYFAQFPINRAEHWGLAQKELFDFLKENGKNYREIIISRPQESFYAYLLFYNQYHPEDYWKEVRRYPETEDGFVHVKSLGKYQFRDINYPEDLRVSGRLLIDKTLDMITWATSSSYLVGVDATGQKHYIETKVQKQIELPEKKPIFTILGTYSEIKND